MDGIWNFMSFITNETTNNKKLYLDIDFLQLLILDQSSNSNQFKEFDMNIFAYIALQSWAVLQQKQEVYAWKENHMANCQNYHI